MGDGWTGINIEGVQKNIAEFEGAFTNAITIFCNGFDTFNQELFGLWASEKAVEFNPNLKDFSDFKKELTETESGIIMSAGDAASIMASHNGATFVNPYSSGSFKNREGYTPLREILHGIKGMNIAVASVSLEEFKGICEQVKSLLENLPMNLELIDPDGSLVESFRKKVNSKVDKLKSLIGSLSNKLEAAFKNETNELKLGQEVAEAALAEEQLSFFGDRAYKNFQHGLNNMDHNYDVLTGMIDATTGEKIGAGIALVGNGVDDVIDGAIEVVEGSTDYLTYGLNWTLDLGNASSSKEYWQNIGNDISENWTNFNNASNFLEGAIGLLEGAGRTGVDTLVQLPINAANTAIDWLGQAATDTVDWIGDSLGNLWNSIF